MFNLPSCLAHKVFAKVMPELGGLVQLQSAHCMSMPFENIDPLRGRVADSATQAGS